MEKSCAWDSHPSASGCAEGEGSISTMMFQGSWTLLDPVVGNQGLSYQASKG